MLVAVALLALVLAAIFYFVWRTEGREPHALSWTLACFALTAQCCFVLVAGWFPSAPINGLAASAAGLAVMTLALRGHLQRSGAHFLRVRLWPYAASVWALMTWLTLGNIHIGLETGLMSLIGALSLFVSAAMVVRNGRPRVAEWAVAVAMILFACSQSVAAGVAFMQGADPDLVYASLNRAINLVSLPVGYLGVAMLLMFLMTSDLSEALRKIAIRDQLTGVLNRRGFGEQAAMAYASARRTGQSVSAIMSDIDQFKTINDQFGHAAGDVALRHVAQIFGRNRRSEDILARMGREEFALVLPGTDVAESLRIANELCQTIEDTVFEFDGNSISMTASFGVATISDRDTCLTDVVVRADKALYRSKNSGRNRVDVNSSQLLKGLDVSGNCESA